MEYYVYIMTNSHKSVVYIGMTNDLIRRVHEHKRHLDSNSFTSKYNLESLVYYESTTDVKAAIEREKQLKGWVRRKKDHLISKFNPSWKDLYDDILF